MSQILPTGHFQVVGEKCDKPLAVCRRICDKRHMLKERNAIFRFRKESGLSAKEVADKFGVDRATLLRWEVEAPSIPVKRLDDAERITGLSRREIRPDLFKGLEAAE